MLTWEWYAIILLFAGGLHTLQESKTYEINFGVGIAGQNVK